MKHKFLESLKTQYRQRLQKGQTIQNKILRQNFQTKKQNFSKFGFLFTFLVTRTLTGSVSNGAQL